MRRVTRIDAGWLPAADWHEHLNIEYHRGQHTGLHTAPPPGRLSSSATSAELDTWTLDICRYMVILMFSFSHVDRSGWNFPAFFGLFRHLDNFSFCCFLLAFRYCFLLTFNFNAVHQP